eukprot:UN23297
MAKMRHPNIVCIEEFYVSTKKIYLVLELCTGGELFDKIIEEGKFSEARCAAYISQIATAVEYLHRNKVIHHDLKPENILIPNEKPNAGLKLCDFGLAKHILPGGLRPDAAFIGSPQYMAPELFQNTENYGPEIDIWSLGVILYVLLCGYAPFSGINEHDMIRQIKTGQFTFRDEHWKDISPEAKNLITRCLDVDPKKRPTATCFLHDPWIQVARSKNKSNKLALTRLSNYSTSRKVNVHLLSLVMGITIQH